MRKLLIALLLFAAPAFAQSLNFGTVNVGQVSAAQTVPLSNTGGSALTVTAIGVTGAGAANFAETNTCGTLPATLAPTASCTISVTFAPKAAGTFAASLSVTTNASATPATFALAGVGDVPPPVVCLGANCSTPTPAPTPAPTPTPASSLPGAQTFNISAKVLSLTGSGQTVVATDVGGSFQLTPNLAIREDNLIVPGDNMQAYLGGIQYAIPLAKLFKSTTLNPNEFQFYVLGEAGVDRVTTTVPASLASDGSLIPAVSTTTQNYAFSAGGGLNYDPTSSGKFTINIFEARWARLPGVSNSSAIVSSGITLSF